MRPAQRRSREYNLTHAVCLNCRIVSLLPGQPAPPDRKYRNNSSAGDFRKDMAGRILLITDGIAALSYTPALLQLMRREGMTVRLSPTGYDGASALTFVSELAWAGLSGHPCFPIEHLDLKALREAEAVVAAPVSLPVLKVLLRGSTLQLLQQAARPVILVPALLPDAAADAAVRAEVEEQAAMLPPGSAVLWPNADETIPLGAMGSLAVIPPETTLELAAGAVSSRPLSGMRLLLTAGPTVEDFDPVRFISNRSTGKMGTAIALAACRMGANVTMIHGPLAVKIPRLPALSRLPLRSAQQMYEAVMAHYTAADIAVLCAAVADFRPVEYAVNKIKKDGNAGLVMPLERTCDILAALGELPRQQRPFLVGFAAESNDVRDNAVGKLCRKHCDMLCCNDIKAAGCGFATDTNRVDIYRADGTVESLPLLSKMETANRILKAAAAELAKSPHHVPEQ